MMSGSKIIDPAEFYDIDSQIHPRASQQFSESNSPSRTRNAGFCDWSCDWSRVAECAGARATKRQRLLEEFDSKEEEHFRHDSIWGLLGT